MMLPLHANSAKVVPIEGININNFFDTGVAKNLNNLKKRFVTLHLSSGKSISGYVKNVGKSMVHMTELDNRDLSDAVIRTKNIIGFEVQVSKFDNDKDPKLK